MEACLRPAVLMKYLLRKHEAVAYATMKYMLRIHEVKCALPCAAAPSCAKHTSSCSSFMRRKAHFM